MSLPLGQGAEQYFALGQGSFYEFLRSQGRSTVFASSSAGLDSVHGTTIVAASCAGGVVMAGDRRATMGNLIASREIEKVFPADAYSCIGVAGTAGLAVELVRLFQVELEHYEKIEGTPLSIDGKANRLAAFLRDNLELSMAGLPVVPLFAGIDHATGLGRIFSYDATGGKYEEFDFHAIGSGYMFAKGSLKKLYAPGMTALQVVRVVIEALFDAADDDSATSGPDLARGIFPVVAVVDAQGYRRLTDEELRPIVEGVLSARQITPNGPHAQMAGGNA
jgi:proteasome beta subunit